MQILLSLGFVFFSFASDSDYIALRPFKTDGCSLYPDGTLSQPKKWRHCCVDHDLTYWAGGTEEERLVADRKLRACVAATGEPVTARVMYQAVRAGGHPSLNSPFGWGFGWVNDRPYGPLTEAERALVQSMLEQQGL